MKGAVGFMAGTGTFRLWRWIAQDAHPINGMDRLEIGDPVKVCRKRSPLAGQSGTIAEVTPSDPYGAYLVQFENGLQFRYRRNELVALTYFSNSATQHR
jgi:hypothetical protein